MSERDEPGGLPGLDETDDWRREWLVREDGSLLHIDGLVFEVRGRDQEGIDIEAEPASLFGWQQRLQQQGRSMDEIGELCMDLMRQADTLAGEREDVRRAREPSVIDSASEGGQEGFQARALVHLRVPVAQKRAWVAQSRAAGLRLSDWLVQMIEAGCETRRCGGYAPAARNYVLARAYRRGGLARPG